MTEWVDYMGMNPSGVNTEEFSKTFLAEEIFFFLEMVRRLASGTRDLLDSVMSGTSRKKEGCN